eukprot:SAG31_NODE_478_length_15144_cov_15.165769_9_plen_162_part_00
MDATKAAALAKAEVGQEWSERYTSLSGAKDEEIVNLKDKYEFLLKSKGEKLRKFVDEYEEYKAASEEIAAQLREEVQLLYEYTERLTHVMERIECGMYPVRDRGGIKSVRAVTFSFLCPLLEKYGTFIARCNALIEKVSSFRCSFRLKTNQARCRSTAARS